MSVNAHKPGITSEKTQCAYPYVSRDSNGDRRQRRDEKHMGATGITDRFTEDVSSSPFITFTRPMSVSLSTRIAGKPRKDRTEKGEGKLQPRDRAAR